tara:strand:- start:467 stop:685 length:219 start_codon:yes stop_codon:yes gene_type:complete
LNNCQEPCKIYYFISNFAIELLIQIILGVKMTDITKTVSENAKEGWKGFSLFMFIGTTFVLLVVALMALFLL